MNNTPVPHLQLVLYVVRQLEELLLPFGLALRVAGEQPLRPHAAPRLPHPVRLRPTWEMDKKQRLGVKMISQLHLRQTHYLLQHTLYI